MAQYEHTLVDNLEKLRERINSEDQSWINVPDFLGTWTLAPKAISFQEKIKAHATR